MSVCDDSGGSSGAFYKSPARNIPKQLKGLSTRPSRNSMVIHSLIMLQNTSFVALTHRVSAYGIVCKTQRTKLFEPYIHIPLWLPTKGSLLLHLVQDGMLTKIF